jgi:hypothetical protein
MLAACPLLALFCNIARLVPTVGLYGCADASVAAQFHHVSGWLTAPLALVILLAAVRLFPAATAAPRPAPPAPTVPASARRFSFAAPALAAALLAGMALEAAGRPGPDDARPFHDRVRLACQAIPADFGAWRGSDAPMPADVLELLQPNALCNRTYRNLDTGEAVNFNVIQCRDARAMTGHFPPLCFAAHGWTQEQAQDRAIPVAGAVIPVRAYVFVRVTAWGVARLAVIHAVVLPAGEWSRDLSAIWRAAADFTRRSFGAAQIELVFDTDATAAHRDDVARQFLTVNQPLLAALTAPRGQAGPRALPQFLAAAP